MGASQFRTTAKGKTAHEAFRAATEAARYEYGHGGYTGTIAEKDSFVMLTPPDGMTTRAFVTWALCGVLQADTPQEIRNAIEAVDDKWGPAGCVQVGPEEFLFFGWASD